MHTIMAQTVYTLIERRQTMKTLLFRMHTRSARAYGLALALALLALPAIDGAAKDARYSAFGCMPEDGKHYSVSNNVLENSSITPMFVYCPIADTDAFRKLNIKTLNVHGYNGHSVGATSALACVTRWQTIGESCGSAASASGVRDYTLTPDLSAWKNNYADFGFLLVVIPPDDGQRSHLRGYYTSGN
jgi:hypothetical protein